MEEPAADTATDLVALEEKPDALKVLARRALEEGDVAVHAPESG